MGPNPIQTLLRREMGIDAFGLDGDDTFLSDSWDDQPRDRGDQPLVSLRPRQK